MLYVSPGPGRDRHARQAASGSRHRRAYLRGRRLRHAFASGHRRGCGERRLLHHSRALRSGAGGAAPESVHRRLRKEIRNTTQSAFAGLGYDAVNLLAAAIEIVGSAQQKAIPGALEATQDFAGVTGDISFAPAAHIPEKQVTIVHVRDGVLTVATILAPQEVPPP
jgi:hypothetical protein